MKKVRLFCSKTPPLSLQNQVSIHNRKYSIGFTLRLSLSVLFLHQYMYTNKMLKSFNYPLLVSVLIASTQTTQTTEARPYSLKYSQQTRCLPEGRGRGQLQLILNLKVNRHNLVIRMEVIYLKFKIMLF